MTERKRVNDFLEEMDSTKPVDTKEVVRHIAMLEGHTEQEIMVRALRAYIKANKRHLNVLEGLTDVDSGDVFCMEEMYAFLEELKNKKSEDKV